MEGLALVLLRSKSGPGSTYGSELHERICQMRERFTEESAVESAPGKTGGLRDQLVKEEGGAVRLAEAPGVGVLSATPRGHTLALKLRASVLKEFPPPEVQMRPQADQDAAKEDLTVGRAPSAPPNGPPQPAAAALTPHSPPLAGTAAAWRVPRHAARGDHPAATADSAEADGGGGGEGGGRGWRRQGRSEGQEAG